MMQIIKLDKNLTNHKFVLGHLILRGKFHNKVFIIDGMKKVAKDIFGNFFSKSRMEKKSCMISKYTNILIASNIYIK